MANLTTYINLQNWKDEFVNWLRKTLNSVDPQSRMTEATSTFDGDDSTTKFSLISGSQKLSYISTVTISGVTQNYGTDWTIHYRGADRGKIEFTSAPATGTDNISVTFGYYTTGANWIYPDFPRQDLGKTNYPRVGFGISTNREVGSFQGGTQNVTKSNPRISIIVGDENTDVLDDIEAALTEELLKDSKNFYNWGYCYVENTANLAPHPDYTADVAMRAIDIVILNRYEIVDYN